MVLRAFARLASRGTAAIPLDVSASGDPIVWLGESPWHFDGAPQGAEVAKGIPELDRLAGIDALAPEVSLLRIGWFWVVGTKELPAEPLARPVRAPVLLPLLTRPVAVTRPGMTMLAPFGDVELTPLIGEIGDRRRLDPFVRLSWAQSADVDGPPRREAADGTTTTRPPPPEGLAPVLRTLGFPTVGLTGPARRHGARPLSSHSALPQWCSDAAAAAGLEADLMLDTSSMPHRYRSRPGLVVWPGCAVFASRGDMGLDMGAVLRTWAERAGVEDSALARVYGVAPSPGGARPVEPARWADPGERRPVRSPLPLDAEQVAVIRHVRAHPVTLVSGAPGTGKSHTVVATAIDAVADGRSVLVATQSERASDVLAELLRRHPGPVPVLFGSSTRRDDVATELASGLGVALTSAEMALRRRTVDEAAARVEWVERAITLLLSREEVTSASPTHEALVAALALDVPGAFDGDVDLGRARELLDALARPEGGWLDRRRRHRAEMDLRLLLGIEGALDLSQVGLALEVATARRAELELDALGGTTVGGLWDDLDRADTTLRAAVGALAADQARGAAALDQAARAAVASLASALRGGRERRRLLLERVDGTQLLRALPLWVGTLRDIEELLPATASLFDVVILDEASQIDQLRAVSALARAHQAVIVGDPRQLRHVSFLAEGAVAETLTAAGLDGLAGVLDVRRNSIFDAATGAHGVLELVEEHRAAPHLIRFPIERFYRHDLQLATRHPRNESRDCIEVVRVAGRRGDDRVNPEEVAEVLSVLEDLAAQRQRSIGVITPFRAQADAIGSEVLDRWAPDQLIDLGLRVGTVHEFQGSERDTIVLSLGLTDDASPSTRRFVEDPNLFNVLITRARERMVVVTSLVDPPPGLLADWLAQADVPPPPPRDADPGSEWATQVADVLVELGVRVRRGYPVGRWRIDLAIGEGARAVGVECHPHPDGPVAHLDRHRALRRAGWRVVDAFPTRFGHRPAEAAITLAADVLGQLER